jgi:hypothetical protein
VSSASETTVSFLQGIEPERPPSLLARMGLFQGVSRFPASISEAHLLERVAVIQDKIQREINSDPKFDEKLWQCIIKYAGIRFERAEFFAFNTREDFEKSMGETLSEFQKHFCAVPYHEKFPPYAVEAKLGGATVLVIVLEPYLLVGGPYPYGDSITYSIFSKEKIADDLVTFIVSHNASRQWNISEDILQVV